MLRIHSTRVKFNQKQHQNKVDNLEMSMKLHNTVKRHPIIAVRSLLTPDNVIIGMIKFHIRQRASLKFSRYCFTA